MIERIKTFEKKFFFGALIIAFLVPSVFLMISLISREPVNWHQITVGGVFTFFITITITYFNIGIANSMSRKFPWKEGLTRRLLIELALTSLSAVFIISIVVTILYNISDFHAGYPYWLMLFQNGMIAIIINIILMSLLEGRELFMMWKTSLVETEALRRQNIESRYSALISYVNPHFLFNNLNVLSFLISSEPEKAQEFVRQFSWIYRYFMEVKDKSLVSLEQEMEFMKSYIFLQKIRYENKLDFMLNISLNEKEYLLPPFSLQLLIENAIKHNEVSNLNPLMIEVFTEDESLVVRNKLLLRTFPEESTGFGIKNLIERYAHFTDLKPSFENSGKVYTARIPLLNENAV